MLSWIWVYISPFSAHLAVFPPDGDNDGMSQHKQFDDGIAILYYLEHEYIISPFFNTAHQAAFPSDGDNHDKPQHNSSEESDEGIH